MKKNHSTKNIFSILILSLFLFSCGQESLQSGQRLSGINNTNTNQQIDDGGTVDPTPTPDPTLYTIGGDIETRFTSSQATEPLSDNIVIRNIRNGEEVTILRGATSYRLHTQLQPLETYSLQIIDKGGFINCEFVHSNQSGQIQDGDELNIDIRCFEHEGF